VFDGVIFAVVGAPVLEPVLVDDGVTEVDVFVMLVLGLVEDITAVISVLSDAVDEVFTVDTAAVMRDIAVVGDILLGVTFMGEFVFVVKLAAVMDSMAVLAVIVVVGGNSVVVVVGMVVVGDIVVVVGISVVVDIVVMNGAAVVTHFMVVDGLTAVGVTLTMHGVAVLEDAVVRDGVLVV